jgi:hypothetical protein
MKFAMAVGCLLFISAGSSLAADPYTVEAINEPAPSDDLAAEIATQLAPTGYRVLQNGDRAVWEIWLTKRWALEPGAQISAERLYELQPGSLVGVARLPRRGADFRDQTLSRGVYTLRYALQPVDGNHVGTSATRDFLLLIKAEADTSPEVIEAEALQAVSAEAAGSSHPAMLSLKKVDDNAQVPAVRMLEGTDWWALRMAGLAGETDKSLPVDLIVVGHAEE